MGEESDETFIHVPGQCRVLMQSRLRQLKEYFILDDRLNLLDILKLVSVIGLVDIL